MTGRIFQREHLLQILQKCSYIQTCKPNIRKDTNSLSYLIKVPMSQSECIKLGLCVELFLHDLIVANTSLIDIKPKNAKNVKERDHLFIDDVRKIVYYAEIKGNLNLDTEKSKSTINKCLEIAKQEAKEGYTFEWVLVGARYISQDCIPSNIANKYDKIRPHVVGVNDYLTLLNIDQRFDLETYTSTLNDIAVAMLSDHDQ